MKAKRKRIKSKGTLMAWSNGTTTHLQQKQLKELEKDFYHQWAHYNHRVEQGYEWEIDEPSVLRGESMVMEEYSDKLWDLGLHVESLMRLLQAATHLIDWEHVFIGSDINYHHRNLSRFRYLVSRCWERVREDPTLEPLLADSTAYDWFLEMEQKYADCKGTGWIG